ncbi:hypothetical protein TWF173_001255 [Orbilia oligospora]|nr:hypothetical protein TWF173_001255 [Orbilia oligospora]
MARSHQIKDVPFFFLILLGLFFLADFAASERTIPRGELKIGTLEKHLKQVTIAITPKYRRKPRDIDRLIEEFKKQAVPPREKSIYKMTSEHLGTWAVVVDIFPDQDRWEGLISKEVFELVIFQDIGNENRGGFGVQGDPAPAWLGPLADALSDDELERMQMGLGTANKKNKRGLGTGDKKKPISKARVGDDLSQADIEPVRSDFIENLIISQPPDTSIKKMNGITYREREAGSGVVVYVMDSGLDFSHKIFDHFKLLKELDRDNELNYKGAVIIAASGSNQQGYEEEMVNKFSKLIIEILFQLGNLNAYTFFSGLSGKEGGVHANKGHVRPRFFAPGTVSAPWLYDHYRGNDKKLPYISQTTTRYASAMAAGVCAALISRGWEDPLQRMEELSYRRKDGSDYPKLIWNGINRSAWPKALQRYPISPKEGGTR